MRSSRVVASALVGLLLAGIGLWPRQSAQALSTKREVAQSASIDREVTSEEGVVEDRLLNGWVHATAERLWPFVQRKDVPYTVKILDAGDVNAFTTGGGFIYLDEGVLDTVGSDDELAGVIGHETGHDERRHPITLRQRGELLSVIFGVGSIISPGLAALGDFAGQGLMAKTSRNDEYQADGEGLQFVLKAGYDPLAMPSLMHRLELLEGAADAHVDRYLADHPGLSDRIRRLLATPALAERLHNDEALRGIALHDEHTHRYRAAADLFTHILHENPQDAQSALHLGILETYLGLPARAGQHLRLAEAVGNISVAREATHRLALLHADQNMGAELRAPDITALQASLIDLRAATVHQAQATSITRERARTTLASAQARVQRLTNVATVATDAAEDPALSHQLAALGRDINSVIDQSSTAVLGSGTLDAGKESGLWAESLEIMQELATPLSQPTITPDVECLLADYPILVDHLRSANADLAGSVETAYRALVALDNSLDTVDATLGELNHEQLAAGGTVPNRHVDPLIVKAQVALRASVEAARRAEQEYNRARVRQLEVRLSLLNLAAFPQRRAAFTRAVRGELAVVPAIPLPEMAATQDPGEYAAAAVLAVDHGDDAAKLLSSAAQRGVQVLDLPQLATTDTEAVEIMLGLFYMDYTDDANATVLRMDTHS